MTEAQNYYYLVPQVPMQQAERIDVENTPEAIELRHPGVAELYIVLTNPDFEAGFITYQTQADSAVQLCAYRLATDLALQAEPRFATVREARTQLGRQWKKRIQQHLPNALKLMQQDLP